MASSENIVQYEKADLRIGFGTMLELIEKQLDIPASVLSQIKTKQWEIFCSFTHTGYQALVRRLNNTYTGPVNYSADEVTSAFRHAGLFALLAATELANMTGDQQLIDATVTKTRQCGE